MQSLNIWFTLHKHVAHLIELYNLILSARHVLSSTNFILTVVKIINAHF